jgi:hypothetical protein
VAPDAANFTFSPSDLLSGAADLNYNNCPLTSNSLSWEKGGPTLLGQNVAIYYIM